MRIKDIIKNLQKRGMNISFYKRKDGGIRITRINGNTFRGSEGNRKARAILGVSLSEAQSRALAKLKTPKGKGTYNKRRKPKLDEDTRKKITALQRKYRKSGKAEGKPTIRNYRYVLKEYGKKEADRLLKQAERRILGYAYTENVDALLARIRADLSKKSSQTLKEAYNRILELRETFKDRWIPEVYEIIYLWEQGQMNGEEAGEKILAIIG